MCEHDVVVLENALRSGTQVDARAIFNAFRDDRLDSFRPLTLAARHGRADVIRALGAAYTLAGNVEAVLEAVRRRDVGALSALMQVGASVTDEVVRAALETHDDAVMSLVHQSKTRAEAEAAAASECVVS